MNVRRHIEVSGIVQGVGFRPHVYRLARERALAGEISNTPSGVTIEVQGPQETIDDLTVMAKSGRTKCKPYMEMILIEFAKKHKHG